MYSFGPANSATDYGGIIHVNEVPFVCVGQSLYLGSVLFVLQLLIFTLLSQIWWFCTAVLN